MMSYYAGSEFAKSSTGGDIIVWKIHESCLYYLVIKSLLLLINKARWPLIARKEEEEETSPSTSPAHSRQDVLMTATSFHSISTPTASHSAGSAGTRNATTHTHSYILAYTGLLLALQSFLCMPKITDLMAYRFPSGWTWSVEAAARLHKNTD